ncbi:hypothetical protein [Robiginitalea sp. SC105]|nr:hypothetical protein [Robiginitalea sp. SC105]
MIQEILDRKESRVKPDLRDHKAKSDHKDPPDPKETPEILVNKDLKVR